MSQGNGSTHIISQDNRTGFYRAFANEIRKALLEGGQSFLRLNGYTVPGGRVFNFRRIDDLWSALKEVEALADAEEGVVRYRGRIYAGQRGRG
jgi:hypothetical protein